MAAWSCVWVSSFSPSTLSDSTVFFCLFVCSNCLLFLVHQACMSLGPLPGWLRHSQTVVPHFCLLFCSLIRWMVPIHLKFPALPLSPMQVHCSLNKGAAVFRGSPHTLPSDLQATGDTMLRSYVFQAATCISADGPRENMENNWQNLELKLLVC